MLQRAFSRRKNMRLLGNPEAENLLWQNCLRVVITKMTEKFIIRAALSPEQDIVYVPQDIHVFQTSVRENITLGEDFSEQELTEVLKQCCLVDWVQSLPNGLDEVLGEKYSCSGGEAQRIGLARALLRHPKMLILDEITSALDNKTAVQVEQNLLSQQNR